MSSASTAIPRLLAGTLALLSAAALVTAAAGGSFALGIALVELRLTVTTAILSLTIAALGFVVLVFAGRYSIDDPHPNRLQWLMLVAIASAACVATAATVVGLLIAWLATTAALSVLLVHRADLAVARAGRASALAALGAADGMLILACATVLAIAGNVSLTDLDEAAAKLEGASVLGIDAATLTALLIVGAALGRCAQVPFGAWLTQTLAAPTPVSALLHAGIVNAGGLLIVLAAPLVFASGSAVWLLFAAASVSMLFATSLMTARPDIKGALALSTRGQMAFMLLQCAMGAFAAALFHLIAHGMYKAYLFLGSGGVVAETRLLANSPHSPVGPATGAGAVRQTAIALVMPALLVAAAVAAVAPGLAEDPSGVVLLLFAYASGAQATWWWLRLRRPVGAEAALANIALAAATVAYVLLLSSAKDVLGAGLPTPRGAATPAGALVPVIAIAFSITALRWLDASRSSAPGGNRFGALNRRAYAMALQRGSASRRIGGGGGGGQREATVGSPVLASSTATLEGR